MSKTVCNFYFSCPKIFVIGHDNILFGKNENTQITQTVCNLLCKLFLDKFMQSFLCFATF